MVCVVDVYQQVAFFGFEEGAAPPISRDGACGDEPAVAFADLLVQVLVSLQDQFKVVAVQQLEDRLEVGDHVRILESAVHDRVVEGKHRDMQRDDDGCRLAGGLEVGLQPFRLFGSDGIASVGVGVQAVQRDEMDALAVERGIARAEVLLERLRRR